MKKNLIYILVAITAIACIAELIIIIKPNKELQGHNGSLNYDEDYRLADAPIYYNSNRVAYNNSNSGMSSNTVQNAIDELYAGVVGDCYVGYTKGTTTSSSYTCNKNAAASSSQTDFNSLNVKYDNSNGVTANNIQAAIDELASHVSWCNTNYEKDNETNNSYDCVIQQVRQLQVGDYFSLTPTLVTYSISDSITGYTSDQTINPSELTLWRVIDIQNNGSVDAVSEYVSSTSVYFGGTTGYANLVGGLQTIAASYANDNYTIATRMMGYDGQTLTIQNTQSFNGSTRTAPSTTTTPSPSSGTGQEYGGGVQGDSLYLNDCQLVSDVYIGDTTTYGETGLKTYEENGTEGMDYWLSSRYYGYSSATYYFFSGRSIGWDGVMTAKSFRFLNARTWSSSNIGHPLRPIITLKSGVTLSGGSGTKASPYTLS